MRTILPGAPRDATIIDNSVPPELTPTLFGTHPSVAANPSGGDYIISLYPYGGELFIGYGNWQNNTGPLDVASLSLTDGTPTVHFPASRTEAFGVFREIDGYLYMPWLDTRAGLNDRCGYTTNAGGTWHEVDIVGNGGMVHNFDIVKMSDGTLVCAGSLWSTEGAALLYSTDNGATWAATTPPGFPPSRFYFLADTGDGYVYMAGGSTFDPGFKWSLATGWEEGWPSANDPFLASSIQNVRCELNGKFLLRNFAVSAGGVLERSGMDITPQAQDVNYVYGRRYSFPDYHIIYRTTDGLHWEPLFSLPTGTYGGLAVHNGNFYVGGSSGGNVYTAPIPA